MNIIEFALRFNPLYFIELIESISFVCSLPFHQNPRLFHRKRNFCEKNMLCEEIEYNFFLNFIQNEIEIE